MKKDAGWMSLDVKCTVKEKATGKFVEEFICHSTNEAILRCQATYGQLYFNDYVSGIAVVR